MKNIYFAILYCLTFSLAGNAQSFKASNIIADKASKQPLGYVNIYNDKDNSVSNADGVFVFVSSKNDINFSFIGYNTLTTTFEAIAKQDTIFMDAKAMELKEVVITNITPFMKKVYDKMNENILSNYSIDFFLRSKLKLNDSIVKLQDISGKRQLEKDKEQKIEIVNMRKTNLLVRTNKWFTLDMDFLSFNDLFNEFYPPLDKYFFSEEASKDNAYKKINFEVKEKSSWGQTTKGYYIINLKDYAIVESFISFLDAPNEIPYSQKMQLVGIHYKTTKIEKYCKFTKSNISGKYYRSYTRFIAELDMPSQKRNENARYYNLVMDYFTTTAPTNEPVNANFSVDKDIFKAKFDYSADFWDNQNQLPLTQELKNFLKRVAANKDKKKEFEVIGNF